MNIKTTRRTYLKTLMAIGISPSALSRSFAATDNVLLSRTVYLGAAKTGEDSYSAILLDKNGEFIHSIALPQRAHGAATYKQRGLATVFARRPGQYMCCLDLKNLSHKKTIQPEKGRHFYGHGSYTPDGRHLITTENNIDTLVGVVGIYDVKNEYRRKTEFTSHGIGPHEVITLPGTHLIAIANGGIKTHPESGRQKLNLTNMHPSIALIDTRNGKLRAMHYLPDQLHKLSIRHLVFAESGTIWFAGQYQSDDTYPATLAGSIDVSNSLHSFENGQSHSGLSLLPMHEHLVSRANNYLSSVAASGNSIIFTSSKGGFAFEVNAQANEIISVFDLFDCSGVAPAPTHNEQNSNAFLLTNGLGNVTFYPVGEDLQSLASVQWDNHISRFI